RHRSQQPARTSHPKPARTSDPRVSFTPEGRSADALSAGAPIASVDRAAASTSGSDHRLFVGLAFALSLAVTVALFLLASLPLPFADRASAAGRILTENRSQLATIGLATLLGVMVGIFIVFGLSSG
ncbi:MAG: hypothetical protein M3304_01665, partial [Actinomycetota bacterium]|nr:hypothetical protein [Actinomycetota bacterium]